MAVVEVVVSGHFGTEIDPPSRPSPHPLSLSLLHPPLLHCLIHLTSFLGGNDVVIIVLVQVFFCCEILVFLMFQVDLDQRDADSGWYMWVGVTTAAPDTLALPRYACRWKSAVVIAWDSVHECGSVVSKDRQERLWIHISNIWIYLLSPVGRSVCPSSSLLLLFRSVLLQCDSEVQGDNMEVEIA